MSLKVAVDLMPVLPGGLNGGAKALSLDLLNGLAARGWRLFALCGLSAFEELRSYLLPQIDVHIVAPWQTLEERYQWMVQEHGPFAVNFSPFPNVALPHSTTAVVSVVHDIQFADLPGNFTAQDLAGREAAFRSCVHLSERIITISNYSKSRIEALSSFPSDRIDVVRIAPRAMRRYSLAETSEILAALRLEEDGFVIYPANFWEHKNHRTLLAAYNLFRSRAGSPLKLVLTGDVETPLGCEILTLARGIAPDHIVVPGYLPYRTVEILIQKARAVLFPSEYEGFGIPIVEAMQSDVPVAAAWSSCLPEVSGGAALLFDPTRPQKLADAIARITESEDLRQTLVARGRAQVARLGTHDDMVTAYEKVLTKAAASPSRSGQQINGITADGWVGRTASIATSARTCDHRIEAVLALPDFHPLNLLPIAMTFSTSEKKRFALMRGASYRLQLHLPKSGGTLVLTSPMTFQPSQELGSSDTRALSFRIEELWVVEGEKRVSLLQSGGANEFEDEENDDVVVTLLAAQRSLPQFLATAISRFPATAKYEAKRVRDSASNNVVVISAEHDATDLTSLLPPEGTEAAINIEGLDSAVRHIAFVSQLIEKPTVIASSKQNEALGFSVVVPSYNQGRFIKRTVDSVLRQTGVHDFHVFDGGSQDETVDVLRGFAGSLKYQSERDNGQSQAVNRGIAAGSGSIIAWLNSDDTYEPDAFARVADIFARCPDVGVVYGDGYHIDEDDQIIERYPTEDFRLSRLFETCFLCQPATFFRREVVERHGGLRETLRYCMDYELWLRFGVAGVHFHRVDAFLANTRLYADTKTLAARPHVHREINDMFYTCFGTLPKKWLQTFAHIVAKDIANGHSNTWHDRAYHKIKSLSDIFWKQDAATHDAAFGAWR